MEELKGHNAHRGELSGAEWHSDLGKPGCTALLSVVTLGILGPVLNPFNRLLQSMQMLLV